MNVVFGDNQFLGVEHSGRKVAEYTATFQTELRIADTLREAWDAGMREYAFTATPTMLSVVSAIGRECPFILHPAFPYAQAVNKKLADRGFLGVIADVVRSSSIASVAASASASLRHDYRRAVDLYIKYDLPGIDWERVGSIGLLNVATDFLLGLRRIDILDQFCEVVRARYGRIPVLYTMNFPKLARAVWGDDRFGTRIIFNFNERGFRVNPSMDAVVHSMHVHRGKDIYVMSLYSGRGATPPEQFISAYPAVRGVLFGSSSPERIRANFEALSAVGADLTASTGG